MADATLRRLAESETAEYRDLAARRLASPAPNPTTPGRDARQLEELPLDRLIELATRFDPPDGVYHKLPARLAET